MWVANDDVDLIYEVSIDKKDIVFYDDNKAKNSYLIIKLNLVCGKDWVDVNDYGGTQGWIPAEYFIEDVQFEEVVCYFVEKSVEKALKENGYNIIGKLPKIEKPRE